MVNFYDLKFGAVMTTDFHYDYSGQNIQDFRTYDVGNKSVFKKDHVLLC